MSAHGIIMILDFERDIQEWSKQAIRNLGYTPKRSQDAASTLAEVFSILRNRIPPIPREIKVAQNFVCPEEYSKGYQQIISEIEQGVDLKPRGSRKQTNEYVFYDDMLLDWNIYHLHLGHDFYKTGDKKGLIKGNKELLFVFFTEETAYIIGVFDHKSWTKQEVLELVYLNWPDLLLPWKINRAVGISRDVTDNDRKLLRGAQINSPIKIGDNIYMGPGGGITTAGTGTNEIRQADQVLDAAENLTTWVIQNADYVQNGLAIEYDELKFDVSRYVLTKTYSFHDVKNNIRVFVPSQEPLGTFIHPAYASLVEPDADNYSYHDPRSQSGVIIERL